VKVIHAFKTHKGEPYHVILQKKIVWKKNIVDGLCEYDSEDCKIKICQKLVGQDLIETIIHEMAHAFFSQASETNVTRFARSVITLLKKMRLLNKFNDRCHYHSKA
jgi:hypothetical protein